ncbi:DUF420 domain-containing protein [Emticicia sp. TH156]|uniref:DUF420 domain-containing protein n=1 Tax=Emticicia sp. TH156 TaxID=2067454 RepID=UPI000C76E4AA|nr:DUF420 domain-containing protein [Emticicia sp. TH156]PLK45809.1 DUF420 domain-containing protein [Emticicia sp. TH156]
MEAQLERKSMLWINLLSVVIPVAVALLLGIPQKIDFGAWTSTLPHVIGVINSLTAVLLLYGFYLIKQGQIEQHKRVMTGAFALGALFLLCYVAYHISNPSTKFGGEGTIRYIYFFVLISHIGLSFIVLPLVLRTYYFSWSNQMGKHKKIARIAFPIWLYVSITGVIAYIMIRPYYV